MSDSPISNLESPIPISRRQALAALGAGTAALIASNAVTGNLAYRVGDQAGAEAAAPQLARLTADLDTAAEGLRRVTAELADVTAARDQALADLRGANLETLKLRGLIKLYETLEAIPIDSLISLGIKAVAAPFAAMQAAASALRGGVQGVDGALTRFEAAVPGVAQALDTAENNLRWVLEDRLEGLRRVVAAATERVEPLAEGLGAFFNGLIDRIPGSVGERIRDVIGRIRELLGSLDARLQPVRDAVVAPLRRDWFATDGSGVQGGLFTPLRQNVLSPLDTLLARISDLSGTWQANLVTPVEDAIRQRDAVRQQIRGYRAQHDLGDHLIG